MARFSHAGQGNNYIQLIDDHGEFNDAGLESFISTAIPSETGTSYRVIAIIGPQSSGESTLLNFLFDTNFPTMNGFEGRGLTTQGVWMARCENIMPCTIVMDIEGTDGAQREDNTAFENQSTLFAVAISDVLIVNIKNDDIGRNQGANRPLLRIVFQAMLKLFGENPPRKTTLMFVIRDRSVTHDNIMKGLIREDIEKIWNSFEKPQAYKKTSWNVFFDVEVALLHTYIQERDGEQYAMDETEQKNRKQNERFKSEVARLKQRFSESREAPAGGLVGERQSIIHISGFAFSAREMWRYIKENRDLNLPSHWEMVAKARCREIAYEKYNLFVQSVKRENLKERTDYQGVGNILTEIHENTLSDYDAEAVYYEEKVRCERQKKLETKLLQYILFVFKWMVGHIQNATLNEFKEEFERCTLGGMFSENAEVPPIFSFIEKFDSKCQGINIKGETYTSVQTEARHELWNKIDQHIMYIPKSMLKDRLSRKLKDILDGFDDNAWPNIRKLVPSETKSVLSEFPIVGFYVEHKGNVHLRLKSYSREVIKEKMREEAGRVLDHLMKRFHQVFDPPKKWTLKRLLYESKMTLTLFGFDDDIILKRGKHARKECLKWLSTMAAIRLYDDDDSDNISETLTDVLNRPATLDCLTSELWTGVSESKTLITPLKCHTLYPIFYQETERLINIQVKMRQEKKKLLVLTIDIGLCLLSPIAVGGILACKFSGCEPAGTVITTTAQMILAAWLIARQNLTGEKMSPDALTEQSKNVGVSEDHPKLLMMHYSMMLKMPNILAHILPLLARFVVT